MITTKSNGKKQKNNGLKIFHNKTFIKGCKYNSIILIIATSLILNIIYLPKALIKNNNQNNNITSITIKAINDKAIILPKTNYITSFITLGDLLNACPNDFKIKKTQLGRLLVGVKGIESTNNKFGYIAYWNNIDNSFIDFPVGIDDVKLENNEILQFALK